VPSLARCAAWEPCRLGTAIIMRQPYALSGSGCRLHELDSIPKRIVDVNSVAAFKTLSCCTSYPRPRSSSASPRRPSTKSAGWALRAGRKSDSTPKWILSSSRSNQHPPRCAKYDGLGTSGIPRASWYNSRARFSALAGIASCTCSRRLMRWELIHKLYQCAPRIRASHRRALAVTQARHVRVRSSRAPPII
jgi:hypothetical protein